MKKQSLKLCHFFHECSNLYPGQKLTRGRWAGEECEEPGDSRAERTLNRKDGSDPTALCR